MLHISAYAMDNNGNELRSVARKTGEVEPSCMHEGGVLYRPQKYTIQNIQRARIFFYYILMLSIGEYYYHFGLCYQLNRFANLFSDFVTCWGSILSIY